MSEALRSLERAHAADPSDTEALHRLQDERVRRGLGWHGERLPLVACEGGERLKDGLGCPLLPHSERGVYVHAFGCKDVKLEIQLVYVPGGEVECPRCSHRPNPGCLDCSGWGKTPIKPFYLGRFPVTWNEFLSFSMPYARRSMRPPSWAPPIPLWASRGPARNYAEALAHHPVVNVSLDDARAFCAWAGLRLPSEQEWKWAALGAPVECPNKIHRRERFDGYSMRRNPCPRCFDGTRETQLASRRYPWGSDPPSPERCVWAWGERQARPCPGSFEGDSDHAQCSRCGGTLVIRPLVTGTEPVLVPERARGACCVAGPDGSPAGCLSMPSEFHPETGRLVPARPLGASWCGAMDMAGNVWEWLQSGAIMGGSFRTPDDGGFAQPGIPDSCREGKEPGDDSDDDIGFRVALSAAP